MEDIKDKTAMQKTQIFNVIILDRSGSMQRIRQAAVDGFNETLVGIKKPPFETLYNLALALPFLA